MSKTSTQEPKFKYKQDYNGRDNTTYISKKEYKQEKIIIKKMNDRTERVEYEEIEIDLKKMWEDNYNDILSQLEMESEK